MHKNQTVPSLCAFALLLSACSFDDGITEVGQIVVTSRDDLVNNRDIERACGRKPDQVVLINDFSYTPQNLQVKVGDTVAWVNQEICGDFAPETAAAPLSGCDNHHEVVTSPMTGSGNINSGQICSPTNGILPPPGSPGPEVNPSNCKQDNSTNVFCHTFTEPGMQSYTCFTNPGHTAAMLGTITVSP